MAGFAQHEDRFPSPDGDDKGSANRSFATGAAGDKPKANRALEVPELESALQLLVERAQYITGATGTALALPMGTEMVCRASAGSSAPAVGARLQVLSGLTGESISRRQLLRCDNAETDPRVNLEACRALGIASIVVLPMFKQNGEVRGLIELFSDHPYAFEERDLVALERMADLTLTALDLAEQRPGTAAAPAAKRGELENTVRPSTPSGADTVAPLRRDIAEPSAAKSEPPPIASLVSAPTPEPLSRPQKCASCGFPISEGRTLCLDCEKKEIGLNIEPRTGQKNPEANPPAPEQKQSKQVDVGQVAASPSTPIAMPMSTSTMKTEEFVPAFLANAKPFKPSWLSNPLNILAIVVVVLGALVAIVVFR